MNHSPVLSSNSVAPKDRRSAPPGIPLAAVTRAAGPAGTCDVRGVMLHLGPGASRKRVPPSPDVPSGNTLGSITRRSQVASGLCSSRASRMLGSLSLASSDHLTPHGQAGGGSRPPVPLRFTASRPAANRPAEEAPRPGLRHHVRASHHASGPPRFPS